MKIQQYRIEIVIVIDDWTLAVYYSLANCYQFSVIDGYGNMFDFDDIFYSLEAAEGEGRQAVEDFHGNSRR